MLAAYAGDRLEPHPRVALDGGSSVRACHRIARRTGRQISWNDLLPRAGLRWELPIPGHISALAGYSRTAHRLVLTDLAWGDASAPSGSVYRWNSSSAAFHAPLPSERGTLVARVGPGSGAAAAPSSIDPSLRRPAHGRIDVRVRRAARPDDGLPAGRHGTPGTRPDRGRQHRRSRNPPTR